MYKINAIIQNMKNKLIVLFGWYGVFAIVLAYALLSFGVIDSTSLVYQILNITGALGIVIISFHKKIISQLFLTQYG